MEKHYAKMKAYFIEQFGEGALEEQEEDHAVMSENSRKFFFPDSQPKDIG